MRRSLQPRAGIVSLLMMIALALVVGSGGTAGRPAAAAPAAASATPKLYGNLAAAVGAAQANDRLRVIVHLREQVDLRTWPAGDKAGALRQLRAVADRSQGSVRNFLGQSSAAATVYQSYWIFNGFAVEAPASTIAALAARDDVAYIIQDGVMTLPRDPGPMAGPANAASNWNIYQVNAPQAWALGYDGTGRTLANQDSGVEGSHEALAPRWRGIQPGHTPADSWFDPFGISPTFPSATGSHGTHTMGTIAGYFGDATGPNEIGQSKGANWIACRIYDNSGKGPFSYIHGCFQFMADPDNNPATNDQPDSVGNSWGDSGAYNYPDLEWYPDIQAWRALGIYPVFSNGNDGSGPGTVGNPGSYPISIGVGAVDINRNIAGFSSRGPALNLPPWNDPANWERTDWNRIKPEVVAPGVNVRSSIPVNTYGNNNGTSMAAPHVTGLAGILRQIRPNLSVNEFYNIIIDTAFFSPTWGLRPNNNYGWGEIDDYAAALYVRDAGTVAGTVMNTACSAPVVGAAMWVYDNTPGSRAQGVGIRKLVSDNNGQYATILAAGQYTVSISAPGFYGQNIPVSITSNTTTTLPIPLLKMATGTVSGTVTDGTSPVSGATVSVDGLSNVRTTTNAQGQYTLSNVPDGTFTIRAEQCGATGDSATVTVTYPNTVTRNFVVAAAPALLADDFESGTLNNWTVTGGSAVTGIWNPSTVRAVSGIYAARAGIPGSPSYTGTINTYMTSNTFDASASDRVWLSFNLYDSSESEYDIIRAQVSSNGGTTWVTVYGEASPVHGWQAICLDLTAWKSATMQIRFYFHTDSTNWNNEVFEGPSIDDVRFAANTPAGAPTNTPVVAMTPTPGTPIPCTPMPTATRTPVVATATPGATETPCPMTFSDVQPTDFFYTYVHYLYCHGVISGYADNTFRPYNNTTRGQMVKIVVLGFGKTIIVPPNNGYTFADVLPGSTFFPFVETAAAGNIVSGYACGGVGEPCDGQNRPYFRPGLNVTRGQLAKIDVVAAGWAQVTPATPTFADVPVTSPFYGYIEAIAARGIVSGYNCGSAGEPCDPQNRQYYRSGNNATRAQISKIVYLSITAP